MTITTSVLDTYVRVDELGRIKADISTLNDQADEIKADLIEAASVTGKRAFEGELFRATVSFVDKRVTDYRAVLERLVEEGFVPQNLLDGIVEKFTKVAEGVPTVRVSARKA